MTILNFLKNHARSLMTLICLFTVAVLLCLIWADTRQPNHEGSTLVQQTSADSMKITTTVSTEVTL